MSAVLWIVGGVAAVVVVVVGAIYLLDHLAGSGGWMG